MIKTAYFIFSIILGGLMVSCGDNQKPSERVDVWGDTETEEVELSAKKVCVPFKRTSADLAEVQVSLNGVPI